MESRGSSNSGPKLEFGAYAFFFFAGVEVGGFAAHPQPGAHLRVEGSGGSVPLDPKP